MFVIKYKKFFIGLSLFFVAVSIALLAIYGLKLGIDFTGGSATELAYTDTRPETGEIMGALTSIGFTDAKVQTVGEQNMIIKSRDLSEGERASLVSTVSLGGKYPVEQKSFTSIGPSVGKELKNKAIASIIIVLIAIICFVAYALP